MSWIGRFANLFHRKRLENEIAEELASHIEEAIEQGRSVEEVQKAFGGQLLQRERSRDIKLVPWIDSLISDVVFGWRQLHKRPLVTAAAILSLALAIGATTAAFRPVDAILLRTLPVAQPERLFYLAATYIDRDGHQDYREDFDYGYFYPTPRKGLIGFFTVSRTIRFRIEICQKSLLGVVSPNPVNFTRVVI